MKPPLGFIVLALVWSVPLATYAIWLVRRAEREARRRIEAAVDQVDGDASAFEPVAPLVPDSRSHLQRPARVSSGNPAFALR